MTGHVPEIDDYVGPKYALVRVGPEFRTFSSFQTIFATPTPRT